MSDKMGDKALPMLKPSNCLYKRCSNEKVQNDTVGINADFSQSVHHRPEHKNLID